MIGAGLARKLSRAVDGDRDLVGDRRHEQKVSSVEDSTHHRADRHYRHRPSAYLQLRAEGIPLLARDAVDLRLRPAGRRRRCLDMGPDLAGEALDLVLVETDRMEQLVGGSFAQPQRSRGWTGAGEG